MSKLSNGGIVFHLMCERPTELGLAKEWEKTVYVPEPDVQEFVSKFNMKKRGGLLYITEYVQHNQRRPQFAELWEENKPTVQMQRKTRRTKAEMVALREAHEARNVEVAKITAKPTQTEPAKKRVRRTTKQIELDTVAKAQLALMLPVTNTPKKRIRRTYAQLAEARQLELEQRRAAKVEQAKLSAKPPTQTTQTPVVRPARKRKQVKVGDVAIQVETKPQTISNRETIINHYRLHHMQGSAKYHASM